jgi:hypothetical protein
MRPTTAACLTGLLAAVCLAPPPASATQVIDEGVLSIRVDGREIGREEFSVRSGRGPDGNVAGTTITALARYPAINPHTTYTAVLERSDAGRFTVFQLEVDGPGGSERYLGAQDRGRITIHRFVGSDREAREFPGGATAHVMVDSVFALHYLLVDLASPSGTAVMAYLARTGGRRQVSATRVAEEDLQVRVSGDTAALITLDNRGRILRIDFTGTSLSVVRLRN